jgi:hypothetical protein
VRIVELGTFLLPTRLNLGWLLDGGREAATTALAAEFTEFASPPPLHSDGLLIDFHRSLGARQMETLLFEGAVDQPGLGRVNLYLSSLSVGFVVAQIDIPDGAAVDLDSSVGLTDFKSLESGLTTAVAPLITAWCDRVQRALPPEWTQARPTSAMASGRLLWWHRIAVDPPAGSEFAAPRFFGVDITIGGGVRCAVANGFTNIHGPAGQLVDHVAEGIMVATQEWLIVDEAQRLLSDHLVRLSQTRGHDLVSVDGQYDELLTLTEEVTLRKLVLSEEQRYLANTRTKVKEAAIECWRLDQQTAELEGRIAALRDLFALHRERITNDRDERRNLLIFVFTEITIIESALVWYDFLTRPDNAVSQQPRPTIAVVVLGLTVLALGGTVVSQVRNGLRVRALRRGRSARLPRPRRSSETDRTRSRS